MSIKTVMWVGIASIKLVLNLVDVWSQRHQTVVKWSECCFHRLFMEILNSCSDCDEIQFKEDGNWAPMRSKKEVQEVSASFNGVDNGM